MRRSPVPIVLLALAALTACGTGDATTASGEPAQAAPAPVEVRVSGSGTVMPLIERLAEAYQRTEPGLRFVFAQGTNSGGGIKGVKDGTLDLAAVNRELKPEEAPGVELVPLARDAVAFAVGPDIDRKDVSAQDVRRIYGGEVTDWAQLGEPAGTLVVLDRDEDESARKLVLVPLLAGQPVGARTVVLAKASEMAEALTGTPGALGYTAVGYLRAKGIDGVRLLSLDGIAPTAAAVADGSYPWSLDLAVVHAQDADPALRDFVAFASGPAAAEVLEAHGYAPPEQ